MNDDVTLEKISPETCFVPATDQGKGRRIAVAPGNTAARYLHYGRITLEADDAPLSFENREQETGLICLKGKATVASEGQAFKLERNITNHISCGFGFVLIRVISWIGPFVASKLCCKNKKLRPL